MADYSIRQLSADEFPSIVPLMKDCFGMDVNIDYFRWKFLDNPAGPFIGFVAVHNETGEIGAYYGAIPERYVVEGQERTVYQSCDTMTHTRHRRKGLFQLLALHCYEHLRQQGQLFVIGFGGGQSTPGFIKFGWRAEFDFMNYFLPRQLCYFNTAFLTPKDAIVPVNDVRDIAPLLWKDRSRPVYSVRTPELVGWRYANPRQRYQVQAYRGKNGYEGYICYYIADGKIQLFDWNFLNGRARSHLMNFLKRLAVRQKCKAVIAFTREGGAGAKTLTRSGFLHNFSRTRGPLRDRTPFIFYADDATMDRLDRPDAWFIEGFDHDAL